MADPIPKPDTPEWELMREINRTAARISRMPNRKDRQAALAQVPESVRERVKEVAEMFWKQSATIAYQPTNGTGGRRTKRVQFES